MQFYKRHKQLRNLKHQMLLTFLQIILLNKFLSGGSVKYIVGPTPERAVAIE